MSRSFKNNKHHTYNHYYLWWQHSPAWARRIGNRHFRHRERQFFAKFGEILRRDHDRGWDYW